MNTIQLYSKAAQIIDALTEVDQASVDKIKGIVQEVMDAYFKNENLPMPGISIKNFTNVRWLGQMHTKVIPPYTQSDATHVLEIQKAILNDDNTLKRVIAHEMIHLWQNINKTPQDFSMIARLGYSGGGHGRDFFAYAAKINAIAGPDYVTEKSDETYKIERTKEFYLLIEPYLITHDILGFGWSWAARPSAQQKEEIKNRQINANAKLFKSKDPRWLGGVQIKKWGGRSIPKSGATGSEEKVRDLKQIFMSGQEIVLN